jgi:hypothetical protein
MHSLKSKGARGGQQAGSALKKLTAENAEKSADFSEKINPNYEFQFLVRLSR